MTLERSVESQLALRHKRGEGVTGSGNRMCKGTEVTREKDILRSLKIIITLPNFSWYLLCVRYCSKHIICIIACTFHGGLMTLLFPSFYRW